MRKDMQQMEEKQEEFRKIVASSADVKKVELLAVVVEEQRIRIDSVIQGTLQYIKGFYGI